MRTRFWNRRTAAALAATALAIPLASCGDDEEDGEDAASAAALEIVASESGQETTLEAPESVEAGVTEITLTNEGQQPHSGQLLRVEGEHDENEVLEGLAAAQRGQPLPDWLFAGGGPGSVNPGESATVTQELEGGYTYWVVDDEARGRPPMAPIEVTGESEDAELPETENVVTMVDYGFESDGPLTAGETVTLENEGEQPHHMIAMPIIDEQATLEDVERFMQTEQGKPPVDFRNGEFTSVLEGGQEQVTAAEFTPGRYAVVCFISDREGGPPHVEMGMIDELEVE